ncbi:MAG: hypothetical protein WAU86_17685 [Oricola sp.]
MANLIDIGNDDLPTDQCLRLSIRWRWISTLALYPGKAHAMFGIGFFLANEPLFNGSVYWPPLGVEIDPLPPGYFKAYDDDCGLLNGLDELLFLNKRFDFEDSVEPLCRLIIAPDAFDAKDEAAFDTDYFDVVAIMYWGGNWHGRALGDSGPAVRLRVTRECLVRFFRDLLEEARNGAVCGDTPRRILRERFSDLSA